MIDRSSVADLLVGLVLGGAGQEVWSSWGPKRRRARPRRVPRAAKECPPKRIAEALLICFVAREGGFALPGVGEMLETLRGILINKLNRH